MTTLPTNPALGFFVAFNENCVGINVLVVSKVVGIIDGTGDGLWLGVIELRRTDGDNEGVEVGIAEVLILGLQLGELLGLFDGIEVGL